MTEYQSLQERIDAERIIKSTAQPRTLKQLAKNPKSINTSLVIQRNLRWSQQQRSALIESVLLGYPIPAVYAIKSDDNDTWILDGKQRLTTFIDYLNDNFELTELEPVFGVDITGMKFEQLPEEFQEILRDHNIVFYQFERLTTEQRDSLFQRLNNGTPLSSVEFTRSVLGTDNLDWISTLTSKPLFNIITEKGKDKFVDVEIVMQMLGVLKFQYDKLSGKDIQALALDIRINGVSEELKVKLEAIIDYLSEGFSVYDEKEQKKLLKKNDLIGLTGAASIALKYNVDAKVFAGLTGSLIVAKSGAYKNTKIGGTNKGAKVKERINLLVGCLKIEYSKQDEERDNIERERKEQEGQMELEDVVH